MCESPIVKGRTGWRGWFDLPLRTARRTDEQWVDLTHPFSTSVPRSAMFPPPRFSYFAQMPEKPLNVTHMETIVHMGTHVDAPRHFYADGPHGRNPHRAHDGRRCGYSSRQVGE